MPPLAKPPDSNSEADTPRGWRFRYSLRTLLTVMFLASVLLAALGGLVRESINIGSEQFLIFLGLALAAPLALLILLSVGRQICERLAHLRRRGK